MHIIIIIIFFSLLLDHVLLLASEILQACWDVLSRHEVSSSSVIFAHNLHASHNLTGILLMSLF